MLFYAVPAAATVQNQYFCAMMVIPGKAKQFLVFTAKLLIVSGAFYFIYDELANNDKLDWVRFIELFERNWTGGSVLFILFLSFANRFLEILKWQNLVSSFRQISVGASAKQVLAALTAGLFTPNGIGEYAGKALYYEKSLAKRIVFLNLICNGAQMLLSVVFGIVGFLFFNSRYDLVDNTMLLLSGLGISIIALILFAVKKIRIKGLSISGIADKLRSVPAHILRKNMYLAVGRYLVFSHQYFFLFRAFEVEVPYVLLMATISSVYFFASSLPTFQFLDFAVKGGVSVFFFGLLGINEWVVIFISMLMWFLNIVIPVTIGSVFVMKYKAPALS
jgi:hypothetical protein